MPEYCDSNHWFYSVLIDPEDYGAGRDELMQRFTAQQIQTRPIWKLNHTQKPYLRNQAYQIEKALFYFERTLYSPAPCRPHRRGNGARGRGPQRRGRT